MRWRAPSYFSAAKQLQAELTIVSPGPAAAAAAAVAAVPAAGVAAPDEEVLSVG